MRVARFLLRRARAQLGTLLTLLVLAATVAAILAGTIGYTRAAGVSTVRSTLVEAPAREAGIQVQTRLADDPDAQDAAVRATLTRLLGPDLAVSRGLWTEPLGARAGQEELRVVLAEPVADVALAPGQVLVPEQVAGELPPGATLEVRGTALEVAGTWHPTDDRAWFADPMVAAGTDGSAVGPLLADPGTVTELTDAPFVRWTVYPDPAALTVTDLPALATGLADLDFALGADDAVAVRGLTVTGGLAQTVADLEEATRTAAAVGLVPVALLGVISLVALVQVVRLLGQARARETEILVARGASPRQVTVWSTAELVVVALVGSAVGTVLAAVVVGRLDGGAAQRSVIAVSGLTVAVLTVVTGAVVTGTQARAIARRMVADRSGRVRGAAAAGTVVLTAAAAVLSAWQLLRHGTPLIADGGADALAVVSLGAVLAALAVLALALLGPLTRLIARVRERERGLVGVLAARQVSRRVRAYAVPLVLVVLAVGATTVASSFAGATTVQRDHVAALATGADVRVTVPTGATSRPAEPRALSAAPYAELPGVAGAGAVLRGSGTFGELPVAVTALDTTRTEELMRVPEQVAVAGAAEGLAPDEAGIALPAGAQSLEVTVRAHLDHSASARETRAAVEAQYREYLVRLEGLSEEEAEAALAEQRARLAAEVFTFAAAVWVADEDGALSMLALDPLSADPDGTDGVVGPEPAEHILRVPLPGPGKYRVVALDVELTGPQTGSDAGFEVVGVAADGQDLPLEGTPWQLTDALGARDVPVEVAGTLGVRAGLGTPPEAAGSFGPLVGGEVAVRLVPAAPAPVPAVVNAALATAGDLTVGDTATVDLAGARVDLTVVAVADAVPGGLEEHALLVDLAALGHHVLARQANPVLPGQVWVTVADDAAAADVAAAARDLAGREAEVEIAGEGMGDSAASVRQAFWIVAAGAVLLALTGVAAVVLALARERRSEVMVLRALGLPPAGQARTRTAELLGVGALGTVLGVLAGWAAAALLVPTLARAAATQSSPLPLGSRFDLLPALGALAALAAGLVVVAAAVAARVRAQALDAEYREEVR
ncbi:FtsX-like permease family protein [uncultured Georgenia sp.]|uniref:FtsX-like permease family protein n=1 Tax=uncultured Georgenia sp. TaxID=378209 RepID=UPI0026065E88|nr:FtsX-like permease family protein [uncultured Georgenia sp.]